jgi:four helix bundle protein
MFDFEKLEVYKKAKLAKRKSFGWLRENPKIDPFIKDQLKRASHSVILNIAEGTGRFSNADRRNFYIMARSSVFECVPIFDDLKDEDLIALQHFDSFYKDYDEISRMLYAMITKLS